MKADSKLLSRLSRIEGQVRGITRMLEQERRVIELCQSSDFSLERLQTLVRQLG